MPNCVTLLRRLMGVRAALFSIIACQVCAPAVAAQEPSTAARGSITGVVTKRPGGEPGAGALIRLLNEAPAIGVFDGGPRGAAPMTTAAADGSFVITGVDPGRHWLVATLPGYLPVEYGQRGPTGTGMPFDVSPGQRLAIGLALWPTSGISGRVVDADGDPIGRVQVLALRQVYDGGKPALTIAQTVITNDRGEYRMFWLTPGSYRVAARVFEAASVTPAVNIGPSRRFGTTEQATAPILRRRTLENGVATEEVLIPIYSPSTPDPQLSTLVTLAPGESASGIDVQLTGNRVRSHHVRGFVQGATPSGRPAPQARVFVVPRAVSPIPAIAGVMVRPDGSFDIPGVPAGSYTAYLGDGAAATRIEVGDSDLDNVVLTETIGIEIKGHLTVERGLTQAVPVSMSELRFQITHDPDSVGAPHGGPSFNPPPSSDGTFSWIIYPGDYRVAVLPLFNNQRDDHTRPGGGPPVADLWQDAYVKSMRSGRSDVLADGLHVWGGTEGSLEIVVSLSGAEVEGTVRDVTHQPAAGVVVVAVPDGGNRGRADLYRHVLTDTSGHFALRGLAPGDYSFYAWDDLERGAWENVEFLRAFEGRGQFVRMREGMNESLDLNLLVGR
jgi:carboxypeptidase family protein